VFESVRTPTSFGDAIMAADVLARFLLRYGDEVHKSRNQCSPGRRCEFRIPAPAHTPTGADSAAGWSASKSARDWLSGYEQAFLATHPNARIARAKANLKYRTGRQAIGGIAREAAVSKTALRRTFANCGTSAREYQTLVAAVHVFELLRDSNTKTEVTAADGGWRSKKNMYNATRQVFGLTPGQIRALSATDAVVLLARAKRRLD
jgi:methylphosphotriester-DNA--protein-cysteine methyltransferase